MSPMLILSLVLVLAFAASVLLVLGLGQLVAQRRVRRRLHAGTRPAQAAAMQRLPTSANDSLAGTAPKPWHALLDSMSRLSVPEGGWQSSALRLKFIQAGWRHLLAPRVYYAIKTSLTLALPALVALVLRLLSPATPYPSLALYLMIAAALGYYLPDVALRWRTRRRAHAMRNVLPDLIDLLVICTESGLGMDAAINRVSQEIVRSSPALAEEFYLAALEIRAGAGRSAALKNLALRVNLEDLHGLVSMLVQADRFGTSLVESLRIQSEMMRVKRMQRAEEIAAKVPVKMLIPLILFIFPALLSVLIGPAVIQIAGIFKSG